MIDISSSAATIEMLLESFNLNGNRPVLVVGANLDKGAVMSSLSAKIDAPVFNLGVELPRYLLTAGTRVDIAGHLVALGEPKLPLLVQHIEALFLPQLNVDAVDILSRVGRRRPVCAVWPGHAESGRLRYASPNHPEYVDADAARAIVHDISTHESSQA